MSLTLRIALIVITLIYMFLILKSIRNKKISVSFSIFWLITGVALIICVLVPQMIEWISNKLGFATPSNMIFCITIFMAFYLIFNLTIILSKENQKSKLLVQEVSLLKKKVENLVEKINESKKS